MVPLLFVLGNELYNGFIFMKILSWRGMIKYSVMICKMNFLILRNVVVNFHFHFDEKINYDCAFISLFIYQIISTSPSISISYSLFISSIIISSITQLNSFVLILY